MCKGIILDEIKESYKPDLIVFIGDGHNDFCPCLHLEGDHFALVRKGKSLEKYIARDGERVEGPQMKAKVLKWGDGKEMLQCFEEALSFVKF